MLKKNIFYQTAQNIRFSEFTTTGKAVICILEWLIENKEISVESRITFEQLKKIVPDTVDEDGLIHGTFFLARPDKNLDVLKQYFEAWDNVQNCFISIDASLIPNCIRNRSHPLTNEKLSDDEFGKQVIFHFRPTENFINSLI